MFLIYHVLSCAIIHLIVGMSWWCLFLVRSSVIQMMSGYSHGAIEGSQNHSDFHCHLLGRQSSDSSSKFCHGIILFNYYCYIMYCLYLVHSATSVSASLSFRMESKAFFTNASTWRKYDLPVDDGLLQSAKCHSIKLTQKTMASVHRESTKMEWILLSMKFCRTTTGSRDGGWSSPDGIGKCCRACM